MPIYTKIPWLSLREAFIFESGSCFLCPFSTFVPWYVAQSVFNAWKLPELSRSLWNELFLDHVDDFSELGFIEFVVILLGWCSKSTFA